MSVYTEWTGRRNATEYWHTAFHGTDFEGFLGILGSGARGSSAGQELRLKGAELVYVSPKYDVATTYPLTEDGQYIFDYMDVEGTDMNMKFVAHVVCHWKKPYNPKNKRKRKQWGFTDPDDVILQGFSFVAIQDDQLGCADHWPEDPSVEGV